MGVKGHMSLLLKVMKILWYIRLHKKFLKVITKSDLDFNLWIKLPVTAFTLSKKYLIVSDFSFNYMFKKQVFILWNDLIKFWWKIWMEYSSSISIIVTKLFFHWNIKLNYLLVFKLASRKWKYWIELHWTSKISIFNISNIWNMVLWVVYFTFYSCDNSLNW